MQRALVMQRTVSQGLAAGVRHDDVVGGLKIVVLEKGYGRLLQETELVGWN